MNFNEAFDKYIKNNIAIDYVSIPAYGDLNKPHDERFYGSGIVTEDGYKMLNHGGGCSGEDCNVIFIVDYNDKIVARKDY